MGWLIKKEKGKYRVWSTVVDDYITDSLTKEEFIKFLFWHKFEVLMKEMVKEMTCFPDGWIDKKTDRVLRSADNTNIDEYYSIISDRELLYNEFFDRIKKSGITIDLKDNKVHIYTPKK